MKALQYVLILTLIVRSGFAATRTSIAGGGNWSSTATWGGNPIPTGSDDVIIAGPVTLDGNYSARTLTINSSRTFTFGTGGYTLTLSGNFTLQNGGSFVPADGTVAFTNGGVTGIVTFNNVTIDGKKQFNFGGNSTVNGRLRLINNADMAYNNNNHPFYGPNAVLDINGTYNPSTNPFMWVNNNSDLNKIAPNIVISGGTITQNQSVTYLKGTFTVNSGATFNGSAGCIFMISGFQSITNNGTISLGGVTVQNGATWNVNGNYSLATLRIESGGTVNANSYVLTINNSTINNCGGINGIMQLLPGGTFNPGTSTVVFNPAYYVNVTADVSGPINFTNLVVSGNNTINIPTANTVTVGGNVTVNNGSTVNGTGNIVFDSTATVTNNSGGSTTFPPTVPTTPSNPPANNLSGSITGSKAGAATVVAGTTATLTGNIIINSGTSKTLTVAPGAELNMSTYTITADTVFVYGKLITSNSSGLSGAFLRSSGTPIIVLGSGSSVIYNSSSAQTVTPRTDYVHLTLSNSGTKTFAAGQYNIAGDFTSTGSSVDITTNTTTFSFNGNVAQSIKGLPYTSPTFAGSGNKILSDTTRVTGVVSITGTANLVSNGLLTLTSTASGTASIGAIASGASLTGKVNYERYIPALRQWRFLSWPLSGNTFANSWHNSMYITGAGTGGSLGTLNSNGFDWTSTSAPTIYSYNEAMQGGINAKWVAIPNTSTAINPLMGYRVYVRGDKSQGLVQLNGSVYTPTATTLRGSGTIVKGDTTVSLTCSNGCTPGNGWNFIANPYPSAIDWNNSTWVSARNSNIQSTIYIFNSTGNNYASWSPTGGSINGGSSVIGSGQSFWVRTTGTASLTFKETYKVNNATIGFFGKTGSPILPNNLKLKIGTSTAVYDECVVYMYPDATHGVDMVLDAGKLDIGTSRIATSTPANALELLSFNAIPQLSGDASDTILISMPLSNTTQTYQIGFEGIESFTDLTTQIYLQDNHTTTVTLLNSTNPFYSFSTTANSASSYAANRFKLIFTTSSGSLPIKLSEFNVSKKGKSVEINWSTSYEHNNKQFDIERSNDGVNFQSISVVKGAGNSNTTTRYSIVDESPEIGVNYYRLKQTDFDNQSTLSHTAVIVFGNSKQSTISVFPIPATSHLNVETDNQNYQLDIMDIFGKTIHTQVVENTQVQSVDISSMQPGVYYLRVIIEGDTPQIIKFLKD